MLIDAIAARGSMETTKAKIRSLYGENKVISGKYDRTLAAVCSNGTFVGRRDGDILSFKGIPYAKPSVGELRWKAPQTPKESDKVFEAFFFGKSPVQTEWPSEVGSYYVQGEDCLTLNVWTNTTVSSGKTVMVFFHGGSYGWGGTCDPIYDGHNFTSAHPDIVLVTVEYRTGVMGFVDLSSVKGGENFRESGNLGLLDMACSLRWVHENIRAFGGNPDNVTIFGESAGGGAVSLLPLMEGTKGLFNRVIAESGSAALTYSKADCARLTEKLLEETGAKCMDDLMRLSEDELKRVNEKLNDFNNFPERDGVVLPEDLYGAYEEGKAAHVDMLIGTNADEARYWMGEMGYYTHIVSGELIYRFGSPVMFESNTKNFSREDKKNLSRFMRMQEGERIWGITEFYNEILFRVPALYQAEKNELNGGRAYVYYWDYPSAIGNRGACHAVELAYVFNNLDEKIYTGDNINPALAATVQDMWVSFAKTGDPSTKEYRWLRYSARDRGTMILGSRCRMEKNWLEDQRKAIEPLLKYGLNGCYTNMDYNVPTVHKAQALFLCGVGAAAAAVSLLILRKRKK